MWDLFTVEETNLMCIFGTDDRTALIAELTAVLPEINEPELEEIALSVIRKLNRMTDAEFDTLGFNPVYENYDYESEADFNGD